jgi:hypothetical protein
MQTLIISFLCFLLLVPIALILPIGITAKGKIVLLITAFLFANIVFLGNRLDIGAFKMYSLVFLLILLFSLLLNINSKWSSFFFKEELASEYISQFTTKDMLKEMKEDFQEEKNVSSVDEQDERKNASAVEDIIIPEMEQFPFVKESPFNNDVTVADSEQTESRMDTISEEKEFLNVELKKNDTDVYANDLLSRENYWTSQEEEYDSLEDQLEMVEDLGENNNEKNLEMKIEKPHLYLDRLTKIREIDNSKVTEEEESDPEFQENNQVEKETKKQDNVDLFLAELKKLK